MLVLPSRPTDEEKLIYSNANKGIFYAGGITSFILLTMGMSLFALQRQDFMVYLPFVGLMSFYLGVSYLIGLLSKNFNLEEHEEVVFTGSLTNDKPTVDIMIPCCGEDHLILENTFANAAALSLTYNTGLPRNNCKVYVLDDKGDREVKRMACQYGLYYMSRPNKGEMKKAGNLKYAFGHTEGQYVLVLDADFSPRRDMLFNLLPYMQRDPKLAIIQSPQYFSVKEEQSYIERGAGYIQELFYRLIQVNRDHFGGAICVGTCALYRRAAIPNGPYQIGYSEDVHTGWDVVCRGWKLKYIPIVLSKGTCPTNARSLFMQNYRWCMGSFTLFLNPEFWKRKSSFWIKLCYLSGMLFYITTALQLILAPLPGLAMMWLAPQYVFWWNILLSLPSFLYSTVGVALWQKAKWGTYSLVARDITYWSHLFAICDRLRGSVMPWVATGTVQKVERYGWFKGVFTFWNLSVFLGMFVGAVLHMNSLKDIHFYPSIFFACLYFVIHCRTAKELFSKL